MKKLITYMAAGLFAVTAIAQNGFTNSGNLQIHAGASLTGYGNFVNTSTAVLINNGSVHLKGDITNDQALLNSGSGGLFLEGNSVQTIDGAQSFKTNNLVTNNSAGIYLNTDLHISGLHIFSSGVITTSLTPNYVVYESGASYSGDDDSKHIIGWVKKIGNTDFTFPVGGTTKERSISLVNLSASSEFNVSYDSPTPNNLNAQAPLLCTDASEYWKLIKISGGTAEVVMNWDNSKISFPNWNTNDIRVASFDGTNWTDAGANNINGTSVTSGNLSSNAVSLFSKFTFGAIAVPLPLTLLSFTATIHDNYSLLNWTTENENNVNHFAIERSEDGNMFYNLDRVAARNSLQKEDYSFRDYKPVINFAYYRLRMIDLDGNEKLSKIVFVKKEKESQISLLTNPVSTMVGLKVNGLTGDYYYSIHNSAGESVQNGTISFSNSGIFSIPLKKQFSNGIYSILIGDPEHRFNLRFYLAR